MADAMLCAQVIIPPRGIRSGGSEKVSMRICGNRLAKATVAARTRTELAPMRAMITSNQTKALKCDLKIRAAKAPSPIETIMMPIIAKMTCSTAPKTRPA